MNLIAVKQPYDDGTFRCDMSDLNALKWTNFSHDMEIKTNTRRVGCDIQLALSGAWRGKWAGEMYRGISLRIIR